MAKTLLFDELIPAREYTSLLLQRGETFRVVDLSGKQVADLVALSMRDKGERLSCAYSNILNGSWRLTAGHVLYSNRAKPIFTITKDTVGLHYSGGGFCTEAVNRLRYSVSHTRNCEENLLLAFKPYGISRDDFDFDSCLNIFMNLTFHPDGSMRLAEPLSRAGDHLDLRAEIDCIVGISNCPQERNPCNGFNPTPIKVQVFDGGIPESLDKGDR